MKKSIADYMKYDPHMTSTLVKPPQAYFAWSAYLWKIYFPEESGPHGTKNNSKMTTVTTCQISTLESRFKKLVNFEQLRT